MDLTSLSSNLPRNGPPESSSDDHDPEDLPSSTILMSSFKSAALSVTTLYKSAAEQVDRSRRIGRTEGYNDCIDDVLNLLVRLEGRSDPKTTELVRQWALSRRRKAGPRPPGPPREDRETSMESESGGNAVSAIPQPQPQPPTQPLTQPPTQPHNTSSNPPLGQSPMNLSPTHATPVPPQMPVFTFRSDHHIPPTVDFDIPYCDDFNSPPTSPTLGIGQNIFQTAAVNKNAVNLGTPRGVPHSRGHQPRTSNKRRYANMNDFFDLAGLEKLNKKGRYQ
ncbi:hypothetical protein EDC01DRAFT_265092 [Geopyxis carbonaria]|nr:hypothetical protein EDC01DRAFT_265092 [Geopyxis carbonaria]